METKLDEIADGIYRLSTFVAEVAAPAGFTFNQFLIAADEPLLFHTGPRSMFPLVADAVARVVPVERLRWITFGQSASVDRKVRKKVRAAVGTTTSWLVNAAGGWAWR